MVAYQVVLDRRAQKHRIKKITVTGETPNGFTRPGPVALWPSKHNTFRRLREARAFIASMQNPQAALIPVAVNQSIKAWMRR